MATFATAIDETGAFKLGDEFLYLRWQLSRITFNDLPKNQVSRKVSLRPAEKTCKNKAVGVPHEYAGRADWFVEG